MIWRWKRGREKIGWTLGDCLFGWGRKIDKILVGFKFFLSKPTKIIYPIWRENGVDGKRLIYAHHLLCACVFILLLLMLGYRLTSVN